MSDQIPNSFIRAYTDDVKDVFQREGGYLRGAVRMKTGVVGRSVSFHRVGKGVATTKARHGVITPMNQDHTMIECVLSDFYAADYVDNLDEAKTNIDERMVIARGGAYALGRKVDEQIITTLDTSANSAHSWVQSSKAALLASALTYVQRVYDLDIPNDGKIYCALTPRAWASMMTIDQFTSADYVDAAGRPFNTGIPTGGKWKDWMGIKWMMHTGLPNVGLSTAKTFIWHGDCVGYATGAHAMNKAENDMVSAKIDYVPERAAHFVNNWMSGGACLIEDAVIEGTFNDTTGVPTS